MPLPLNMTMKTKLYESLEEVINKTISHKHIFIVLDDGNAKIGPNAYDQ